jgi:hypothetical protein
MQQKITCAHVFFIPTKVFVPCPAGKVILTAFAAQFEVPIVGESIIAVPLQLIYAIFKFGEEGVHPYNCVLKVPETGPNLVPIIVTVVPP